MIKEIYQDWLIKFINQPVKYINIFIDGNKYRCWWKYRVCFVRNGDETAKICISREIPLSRLRNSNDDRDSRDEYS